MPTRSSAGSTPEPEESAKVAKWPDLHGREYRRAQVGDISCFPTGEGWLHPATTVDLYSKEVIGYAIMHTDRGSQCHSKAYRNTLRRLDIRQSTRPCLML